MKKLILFFFVMFSAVGVKAANPDPIIDTVWTHQLSAYIYSVKFLPGDSVIFVAAKDTLFFVETKSGKILEKYANDLELESSCLSPKKDYVAIPTKSANNKKTLRTFDFKTKLFSETFSGEVNKIESIAIAPDEKYIAVHSDTNGIGLWKNETHNFDRFIKFDGFEQINVEFSSDNKYLCSHIYYFGGYPGTELTKYLVYSYPDFNVKYEKIRFGAVLFNNGKQLLKILTVQPNQYQLQIYQLDSLILIKTLNIENFKPWGVGTISVYALSKDDRYLITSSNEKIARVWDLEKEINVVNYISVPKDNIQAIAISDNMKYISCGADGNLVLLNAHWEPTSVGDKGLINATLKIAPNIINNSLNIEFVSEFEDKLKLTITSIRADVVFTEENISSITGMNRKVLQIPALANGEYFLNLIGNKSKYSGKFIISR